MKFIFQPSFLGSMLVFGSIFDYFVAQILKLSSVAMTLSSSTKISGKWFPPPRAFFAKRSFSTKPPYFRRGNISTISQEKPLNCWSEYINHLPRALMPPTKLWHDRYLISVIRIFFDLESCAFRNSWGKWRNSQIAVPVPRSSTQMSWKLQVPELPFIERLLVVVVTYDMWYILNDTWFVMNVSIIYFDIYVFHISRVIWAALAGL